MTTQDEIAEWFQDGVDDGATHLIVVCDTFDHEDYPVYVEKTENVKEVLKRYDGVNMQRIMEIYNLGEDIETQINENRAYNL